ncbi:MAG TPA: ATP-binding protein [Thermoleophilaceae bacterium]
MAGRPLCPRLRGTATLSEQILPGGRPISTRRASQLVVPAHPERIQEAREFADEAAASFGFDEDARYDIRLAATEAVTNAIRHGARSPRDTVQVTVLEGDRVLTVCVADQGSFIPRVVNGDPLPEQGRGLAFIAHLMDDVCIRTGDRGTTVRFSKRLPD